MMRNKKLYDYCLKTGWYKDDSGIDGFIMKKINNNNFYLSNVEEGWRFKYFDLKHNKYVFYISFKKSITQQTNLLKALIDYCSEE